MIGKKSYHRVPAIKMHSMTRDNLGAWQPFYFLFPGGTLGLFVGASLLSVMEVAVMLVRAAVRVVAAMVMGGKSKGRRL